MAKKDVPFEVLSDDENSYRIKHPNGKELTIAKKAISDALHDRIKGMVKMKDGGFVPPFESATSEKLYTPIAEERVPSSSGTVPTNPYKPPTDLQSILQKTESDLGYSNEQMPFARIGELGGAALRGGAGLIGQGLGAIAKPPLQALKQTGKGFVSGITGTPMAPEEKPRAEEQAQAPVEQRAPSAEAYQLDQGMMKVPNQAISATGGIGQIEREYTQAANLQAKYASDVAKQTADVRAKQLVDQQQLFQTFQDSSNQIRQASEDIFKAAYNDEIDPNRAWHSASTPQKLSAAAAMLLGGFGAGLSANGRNMGIEAVNRIIDKDLEAQKLNLGKKQTLYSMALQRFQNEAAAYNYAKTQMADMFAGQVAQIADKSADPRIQSQKLAALADIHAKTLPMKQQAAQQLGMQNVNQFLARGMITDPTLIAQLPPETQERYVVGYGLTTKENKVKADEKIPTALNTQAMIDDLLSLADKGSKLTFEDRDRSTLIATKLKANLRTEIAGPGAVTPYEYGLLDKVVANPLEITTMESRAKTRLKELKHQVNQNLNLFLKQSNLKTRPELDLQQAVK